MELKEKKNERNIQILLPSQYSFTCYLAWLHKSKSSGQTSCSKGDNVIDKKISIINRYCLSIFIFDTQNDPSGGICSVTLPYSFFINFVLRFRYVQSLKEMNLPLSKGFK